MVAVKTRIRRKKQMGTKLLRETRQNVSILHMEIQRKAKSKTTSSCKTWESVNIAMPLIAQGKSGVQGCVRFMIY